MKQLLLLWYIPIIASTEFLRTGCALNKIKTSCDTMMIIILPRLSCVSLGIIVVYIPKVTRFSETKVSPLRSVNILNISFILMKSSWRETPARLFVRKKHSHCYVFHILNSFKWCDQFILDIAIIVIISYTKQGRAAIIMICKVLQCNMIRFRDILTIHGFEINIKCKNVTKVKSNVLPGFK